MTESGIATRRIIRTSNQQNGYCYPTAEVIGPDGHRTDCTPSHWSRNLMQRKDRSEQGIIQKITELIDDVGWTGYPVEVITSTDKRYHTPSCASLQPPTASP